MIGDTKLSQVRTTRLSEFTRVGMERLADEDPILFEWLDREYQRQATVLTMVAASSIADPTVLMCNGMVPMNVTAEGYPAARFHAGCKYIDELERLAIERAKAAFTAQYANVQPHSASGANQIVICSLLSPGDTLMGLELSVGGHLTHGARASISGQYFKSVPYGRTETGDIDYEQVLRLAREHRPKLIICGTTAFPRTIDFKRFREIADQVGAYVLADISHIAGLVIAGEHASPIDHAHFTTTCTHKQLYGPRAGLILMGRDANTPGPDGQKTLAEMMQTAVFPFLQGAPNLNAVAAIARALAMAIRPEFKEVARRIVADAKTLSDCFLAKDYEVVTGGTDNHLVILDVLTSRGITGVVAEKALEDCDIVVNKNRIPGDAKSALITSGIRIGTNSLAMRQMGPEEMPRCAELVDRVLSTVRPIDDRHYDLDPELQESVRAEVLQLCKHYPIPTYPFEFENGIG